MFKKNSFNFALLVVIQLNCIAMFINLYECTEIRLRFSNFQINVIFFGHSLAVQTMLINFKVWGEKAAGVGDKGGWHLLAFVHVMAGPHVLLHGVDVAEVPVAHRTADQPIVLVHVLEMPLQGLVALDALSTQIAGVGSVAQAREEVVRKLLCCRRRAQLI